MVKYIFDYTSEQGESGSFEIEGRISFTVIEQREKSASIILTEYYKSYDEKENSALIKAYNSLGNGMTNCTVQIVENGKTYIIYNSGSNPVNSSMETMGVTNDEGNSQYLQINDVLKSSLKVG